MRNMRQKLTLNITENFSKEQTMCNKAFLGVEVRLTEVTWGEERDITGERKDNGERKEEGQVEGRKRERRHDG